MSQINPELFRPTASETLANMALDSLDNMGGNVDHLKSIISKAIQPKTDGPSMEEQITKGLI